jgi:arylsulfatase A-like enzyme
VLLKQLGIEKNTLVMFSGDNGGADYFSSDEYPRGIHGANKHPQTGIEFRGRKGNLYDGGLRVPFVAFWPGKIAPGQASDHLCYFPDILPTIAELTGTTPPPDIDGISILPTLIGETAAGRPQPQHEYLYWEIGGWRAIRQGNWRAVKPRGRDWELYDLSTDPSESKDLAAQHRDILTKLKELAVAAHEPAVEGTFVTTQRHERDRRAKYGKQDDVGLEATPGGVRKKRRGKRTTYTLPTEGALSSKAWKIGLVGE